MSDFSNVVTVDGPSGSGKTTLLAALHRRYAASPVEFGPIVRTLAWWAKNHQMTIADTVALIASLDARGCLTIATTSSATLAASEVVVLGTPMRQRIFSSALSEATYVASHDPIAVAWIAGLVRARIRGQRAVLSGRQAAQLVCPDAGLRIRLEASSKVRATRKARQLVTAGLKPGWSDDIRLLGSPAETDLLIDTTSLTISELEREVFRVVESRLGWRSQLRRPSGTELPGSDEEWDVGLAPAPVPAIITLCTDR